MAYAEGTLGTWIVVPTRTTMRTWSATKFGCGALTKGDHQELERFYAELSGVSRATRFHGGSRGITHAQAVRFASADHRQRDGFVAVADGQIVGHLMLEPDDPGSEELAVAVSDQLQHHGVGTLLLAAAIASARLRGIQRLVAWVLPDNSAMRRLLTTSGHLVRLTWQGNMARYELAVRRMRMPRLRPEQDSRRLSLGRSRCVRRTLSLPLTIDRRSHEVTAE